MAARRPWWQQLGGSSLAVAVAAWQPQLDGSSLGAAAVAAATAAALPPCAAVVALKSPAATV